MRGIPTNFGSLPSLRQANIATILDTLQRLGGMTQIELAEATNLSTATVSSIVRQLVAEHILSSTSTSRNGRHAVLVTLNSDHGFAAGICIEHTACSIVLVSANYDVLLAKRLPLAEGHVQDTTQIRIFEMLNDMASTIGMELAELQHLTIAIPALLQHNGDSTPRIVYSSLTHWDNINNLQREFSDMIHTPVSVLSLGQAAGIAALRHRNTSGTNETGNNNTSSHAPNATSHDVSPAIAHSSADTPTLDSANTAPHAAHTGTSSIPHSTDSASLYIHLDDELSSALFFNSRLYTPYHSIAGELAHTTMNTDGAMCVCGKRGCLYEATHSKHILNLLKPSKGQLSFHQMLQLAKNEDPVVTRLLEDEMSTIGLAASSIIDMFGIQYVAVGGAITEAWPYATELLRYVITRNMYPSTSSALEVRRATVPDELKQRTTITSLAALGTAYDAASHMHQALLNAEPNSPSAQSTQPTQ